MPSHSELIKADAVTLIGLLQRGDVTPHDLLDALEARIAVVDVAVNALPTLCFDRARAHAERLMRLPVSERGPLAGLPVPIKDLVAVEGVRTTQGSPIYADHVPARSDILVQRLEANGGIVYAKSNTPEFGAGANTFNEVFGATRNPWNLARSAAGSSGGAAAALASGTAWVAHGSDTGGSLRNPASFCGIVGMRPSIGRVACNPAGKIDRTLGVQGPMARNVEDLAMTGEHPADTRSLPALARPFRETMKQQPKPRRVAYSATLGITPVDPQVARLTRAAAERLAGEGIVVEDAHPDLAEVRECNHVLRAFDFCVTKAALLRTKRHLLKPEIIWNIEEGLKLTMADIERAEAQRVALAARMLAFFEKYDLLLTPATIVAAFPVEQRYVAECAGQKFDNYIEWLTIASAITLTCCPALSLPCGFTAEGLPVGLQIVAPPRAEARVLAGAKLLEDLLGLTSSTPIEPRILAERKAKTA